MSTDSLSARDGLDAVLADDAPAAHDVFLRGVELRPGVTSDLHLRVLRNPHPGAGREAIVAVPGANCTASTLVALGEALLAAPATRARLFIALSLPGHGKSTPPVGALLGELGLWDYAAAVLGTLDRLKEKGVRATTVVGHSMGGGTLFQTQQRLVQRGTSLRESYGVEHALLLAPAAWPEGVPCAVAEDPQLAAAIGQLQVVHPTLGPVMATPDAVLLQLAWSRPDGTLAGNAPTPAEVGANGWNTPESLVALANLMGAPDVPRSSFDPGIFDNGRGTRVDIVSFEHDTLVKPAENEAVYRRATGESPEHGWTTVMGPNAVHGMPINDPAGMLAAVGARLRLP
jgi:pimeloyl-ACP methyl ester carboxylesterase